MSKERPTKSKSHHWFWVASLGGVLLFGLLISLVDLKWLHEKAQSLNGFALFSLLAFLPLTGVPVSVLYVVTGAKFGHAWGLVVTAAAIAIHLFASWWIARGWLKRPLESLLRKFGHQKPEMPEGESVPICLLVALTPGISYTLKNYLLPLSGVRFKYYFWTCLPAHLFTASLGVLFGGFTGEMNKPRIIFLSTYAVLLAGLTRSVVRRLKRRRRANARQPASGPAHNTLA